MKKTLQKILTTVLAVGVIFSSVTMVGAAENKDVTIYEGGKVSYSVLMPKIDENYINCFQMYVVYDSDKLEYESFEWANKVQKAKGNSIIVNPEYSYDIVTFSAMTPYEYEVNEGDVLATITYTVTEETKLSELDFYTYVDVIGYTKGDVNGIGGKVVAALELADGVGVAEVISTGEKSYDVNGDGKVNISDATAIQKHCAEINVLQPEKLKNADVNGDGKVNVTDATALQKFLVE